MQLNRTVTLGVFLLLTLICLSSFVLLGKQTNESNSSTQNGTEGGAELNGLVIEVPKDGATTEVGRAPAVAVAPTPTATPTASQPTRATGTSRFIAVALERGRDINQLCSPNDRVNRSVLTAYGAIYVSDPNLKVPSSCLPTRSDLETFYRTVKFEKATLSGVTVSFQKPALDAFKQVRTEAGARGLTVTPNGTRASLRDYDGTVEIWQRNLGNGINSARGISEAELGRLRSSDVRESIGAVLEVEGRGILLGSGGGKSILQIAAPPGTSQHISGLSIDIAEHESAQIRALMAKHGFFQTIANDFTHFTYLGTSDTASLGLVAKTIDGRVFFVPEL